MAVWMWILFCRIAGDHIRSINSKGMVGVSRDDHEITQEDVDRAISAAKALALPIDREIIRYSAKFIVDDQDGIADPVRDVRCAAGSEVHCNCGGNYLKYHAQRAAGRLQRAANYYWNVGISLAVLDDDERQPGVTLVDIGGGTADMPCFRRAYSALGSGCVGWTACRNDIAVGCALRRNRLKNQSSLRHGFRATITETDSINVPGVGGRAPRSISICFGGYRCPRMEEILTLAYQKCKNLGARFDGRRCRNHRRRGIVGKLCRNGEIDLGMPVRLAYPKHLGGLTDSVKSPIYSTAVGLCLCGQNITMTDY